MASHSEDMLTVVLATMLSPRIVGPGEPPVWVLTVGDPSCGKSDTMRRAINHPLTVFRDEITAKAMCSGHVDAKGRSSACLLSDLHGKCLACPDLAALFGKDERGVKAFLSTMVNAYDGTYAKSSATQKSAHTHVARFAFIGAVTPLGIGRFEVFLSELGSRLLMHRIPEMDRMAREAVNRSLRDRTTRGAIRDRLTALVQDHLTELSAPAVPLPLINENTRPRVEQLAEVLACGRGVVTEEGHRQIENTGRAVQVLTALVQAIALVRGHAGVDKDDLSLIRTVVLGSIPVERAAVISKLATAPNAMTVADIAGSDDITATTRARRVLAALERLDLAERVGTIGQGGADLYSLSPVIREALNEPGGQGRFERVDTPGTSEP